MDKGLFLLIGASLASTALAQPQHYAQIGAQTDLRGLSYDAVRDARDEPECLIRKSDSLRVCHTRERWRQIAQRLEREEEQKRLERGETQKR